MGIFVLQRGHLDREAVLHVALEHAFAGFVDLVDRDDFGVGGDPVPPSQYQIRLDAARRLLRATDRSVITNANDVDYSSPSHIARLFRKDTGLSSNDYRRQR